MALLSLIALFCVLFALAWRTRRTMVEIAPYGLCAIGLILYVLAFFCWMGLIDWLLLAVGVVALAWMAGTAKRQGSAALLKELRRQLCDPYLWGCVLLLAVMCFALRHEQILEWDAHNFWAPDIKSLYYREGYAAKYSNVSPNFGDYTPVFQLILWWFVHLFGSYQEPFIFYGYFISSGLMLFSAASVFRRRFPRGRLFTWLLIPFCALCVPGVCSTAWYRSIYVDPVMAILFGMILCKIVARPKEDLAFWKAELVVAVTCLALLKSIGILWSVFAALFFLLWWIREKREYLFSLVFLGVPVLFSRSWSLYCQVMERSGYLADSFSDRAYQRLTEWVNGTFFSSEMTRGYIRSYVQAFFATPVHREYTFAIDLSPFAIVVVLLVGAVLLWYFGAVPRKKLGRLLVYTLTITFIIYAVVSVGQLTMFYYETQYLDPVSAVTLMSRYCEPANTGLLMLLVTLSSGVMPGAALRRVSGKRQWLLGGMAAVILLSCTGYREAWRRFVYDELDASRIEKRLTFLDTYRDFIDATAVVPYQESGSRLLLVVESAETNPIVINAVSPVSFVHVRLDQGGEADYTGLVEELEKYHCGYLYLMECEDSLLEILPEGTQRGEMYAVEWTDSGELVLTPC